MIIKTNLWLALAVTFMLTACSTSVERINAQEQIDLSGAWNDTDSQLEAREMITIHCLAPGLSGLLPKQVKILRSLWVRLKT